MFTNILLSFILKLANTIIVLYNKIFVYRIVLPPDIPPLEPEFVILFEIETVVIVVPPILRSYDLPVERLEEDIKTDLYCLLGVYVISPKVSVPDWDDVKFIRTETCDDLVAF